jgi:hypothetical protein
MKYLSILLVLASTVVWAECPWHYYKGVKKDVVTTQVYREKVGTELTAVLDAEGKDTGEKKVIPVYTLKSVETTTPVITVNKADIPLRKAAQLSDTVAFTSGEKEGADFLGKDAAEVMKNALAGDADCKEAIRDILYTVWDSGTDKDGNPIRVRRSLREWIAAGKPKRLTGWYPKVVLAGFSPVEIPAADVLSLIGKAVDAKPIKLAP